MPAARQNHCVIPARITGRCDRANPGAKALRGRRAILCRESPRRRRDNWHRDGRQGVAGRCTMVIVNQNFAVQPAIGEKLAYEVPDSFAPVTLLIAAPETISISPSVPANTLKELVALVKA